MSNVASEPKKETTLAVKTTEVKQAEALKPNMCSVLDTKKKILVLNEDKEVVESTLAKYTVPAGTEGMVHISTVEYLEPKNVGPHREAIKTFSLNTFFNSSVVQTLQGITDGGSVAFRLSEDLEDAALQAFNILLACTEHKKDKEGNVIFTDAAKNLVSERFNLFKAGDIILKCKELRFINWGTVKAFVDDIIHFPGFTGKVEIDPKCMPQTETSYGKNAFDLPE